MTEVPASRAPWHLWVVGILALLWNCVGAFDYLMTQTQNEAYMAQFTPEQLDFFYGFPVWVVALWALSVWGSLLASVLLILRKRLARDIFLFVIATMLLTMFHNFALSNGLEVVGDPVSLLFTGLVIVISVLLYWYARRQVASGVLD